MVPTPKSSYFPALDRCLNGDELLISWKTAFYATEATGESLLGKETAIHNFFLDPKVLELLSQPFNAFPAPSQQSKAAFETKTSAINVTPSTNARFDIKEVKEDALWLSREAKIDEISALRIAVAECQNRTSAQLLGPFSNEELAGIRDAAGHSQTSIPVALLYHAADADILQKDFDTQESRRLRIFRTYLSERQFLIKIVDYLLQRCIFQPSLGSGIGNGKETESSLSIEQIGQSLARQVSGSEEWLLACVGAIEANIKNASDGSGFSPESILQANVELEWAVSQIVEATHTMEILFQIIDIAPGIISSTAVLAWLRLIYGCKYFQVPSDEPSIQASVVHLQSISAIISVQILCVGPCINHVCSISNPPRPEDDSSPYITKTATIDLIQDYIESIVEENIIISGPTILAWSVILQTMRERVQEFKAVQEENNNEASSFGHASDSNQAIGPPQDMYQDIVERVSPDSGEDRIRQLVSTAVDGCHVFDVLSDLASRFGNTSNAHFSITLGARMRVVILDLIRNSNEVGYIPEVVSATLSTLTGGQSYWDLSDAPPLYSGLDPAAGFLQDEEIITNLLISARARYPFESLPFLKLVRSLAACTSSDEPQISAFVNVIPSFTYILPDKFVAYETTQEEDNNNSIRLTQPVQLFIPRSKTRRAFQNQSAVAAPDRETSIPSGTNGRMVSESNPKVAYWFHEYSGFKYFGKLLETFLAAGDQFDATTGDIADRDSVTEIISIFAVLLRNSARSNESMKLLEDASSGLSRNRDITSVVFDIFQEELQRQSTNSGPAVPLELLVSCVQFVHSLITVTPARVWPLIARCGLLGLDQSGGKLSSIVGGVELISGRYDFLVSCTKLYEALVDDYVTSAVARRWQAKAPNRFGTGGKPGTGLPDLMVSNILVAFTRYFVDVMESSSTWRFVEQDDLRRLRRNITGTFDKILRSNFGISNSSSDDTESASKSIPSSKPSTSALVPKNGTLRLMAALEQAALHITDSFLSTSSGSLRVQPLLRTYYDGFATPDSALLFNESQLCVEQVHAVLAFSKTLLRVGTLLERPSSQLENQLFRASPLIARLFAVNDSYRAPVVALFESLILSASNNSSQPPSLLAYLGSWTSKSFLHVLSDLDKPLSRNEHFTTIMHFFSKVISSRQQWFANYLLTGGSSKSLNSKAPGKGLAALDKPPLSTALDALLNIKDMRKSEALEYLEFIALAQNFWPWATYNSEKHAAFITSITEFVGKLIPLQPSAAQEGALDWIYQSRMAAYIAEILAMHLFHSRQTGRPGVTKELLDNLSYFTRFAVAVPQYNSSLHGNLKRNFEARYTGCKLLDFQKTSLETRQLGRDYFYDLGLVNSMLSFDPAWERRGGFSFEVINANLNLSLVDSQIALLHAWKYLALEISTDLSNTELQKTLAKVASDCLLSNKRSQGSEEIFVRLCQTRADLALVLMQRLIEVRSTVPEMQSLFTTTWETIRSSNITFEIALGSGDPAYYRSLLKILFLGLRAHSDGNHQNQNTKPDFKASSRLAQSSSIVPSVLDILDRVVAKGLRDLAAFIHEKPEESSPEDLSLITGILQACLRVPGIEFCYTQLVGMFVSNDSARLATTLFSWSDTLAIGGDPIYGELSILFLVELSTVPAMAEQLGIEGVLSHIGDANIASYLRRGNVSPFADGAGIQRCYSIWTRGILPLVLNLLDSVGVSISAEVSIFLNQFPVLLKQSSEAFDAPETSRTVTKAETKYITFSICSEVHITSLILFILNGFREGSAGVDIPEVKWDAAAVLENAEFWLGARAILRGRILPMGEREVRMSKTKVEGPGATQNKLEEKVVLELLGIRDVLGTES